MDDNDLMITEEQVTRAEFYRDMMREDGELDSNNKMANDEGDDAYDEWVDDQLSMGEDI